MQMFSFLEGANVAKFDMPCHYKLKKPKTKAETLNLFFGVSIGKKELEEEAESCQYEEKATKASATTDGDGSDDESSEASEKIHRDEPMESESATSCEEEEAPLDKREASLQAVAAAPSSSRAGLLHFEMSSSGKAKCFCCKQLILPMVYRWAFQPRATSTFVPKRFLHVHCIGNLPAATREEDLRTVHYYRNKLLEKGEHDAGVEQMLDECLMRLQGAASASGASGSGGG